MDYQVWFYLHKFGKILQFIFLSKIKAMTLGNRKWDRHKPCLLPAQSITFCPLLQCIDYQE